MKTVNRGIKKRILQKTFGSGFLDPNEVQLTEQGEKTVIDFNRATQRFFATPNLIEKSVYAHEAKSALEKLGRHAPKVLDPFKIKKIEEFRGAE